MENTATLSANFTTKATSEFSILVSLATLYSHLLGEEITASKLRHLLHVQLAGVMLLPLAACNIGMLLLGIIWFGSALYSAKTEWEKHQ